MVSESTPLLVAADSHVDESVVDNDKTLSSSTEQASLNIIKMCIGSGTLAMPYAASQGGFLFHMIGLALVTKWNLYSVDRMISSKNFILQHHVQMERDSTDVHMMSKSSMKVTIEEDKDEEDSIINVNNNQHMGNHHHQQQHHHSSVFEKESKSTFSNIALMAFGPIGVHMVDSAMTILMFGIILAYEDAILGFIQETPFKTDEPRLNATFMLFLIIPVLMLPDYESIAKVSALGTGLVCAVFGIIASIGILQNGFAGFYTISWDSLWPSSLSSLSRWFGITVFGYGVVPFTFSIQESMIHPSEFMNSCNKSLWIVFLAYCIMGNGLSMIFMQTIDSDVLSALPYGAIPTALRLLMAIVILTTLPLIIIPAGALVHDKVFGKASNRSCEFAIRFLIAGACAILSVELPSFVFVLSFIGCLCVSFISFVYPPLAHIICMCRFSTKPISWQSMILDVAMVTWGIFVTIFTSRQTYLSLIQQK
jgi:amino acid permease